MDFSNISFGTVLFYKNNVRGRISEDIIFQLTTPCKERCRHMRYHSRRIR